MRRLAVVVLGLAFGLAACGQTQVPAAVTIPTAPTPAAPPPTTEFTVVSTGDFISQPELSVQAEKDAVSLGVSGTDYSRILAAVKPAVSRADLAVCHMETPLAAPGDAWTGYPIFNAPPGLLTTAAAMGYDTCSTASNHTIDYGDDGLVRTLDGLDRAGIRHAGSYRTEHDSLTPDILDVKGVKVAQLSYTFSFNGLNLPEGKPWAANLIDEPKILAEARRAKAAGADIVLLSMHWGTEYQHEADIGQTGLAERLLASPDIDLILGTHVHVVQPFQKLGAKWVQYGMGNVMVRFPDGSPEETQDAVISRYTFDKGPQGWQVAKVEVIPTWMEYYPVPRVVDLPQELARPDLTDRQRSTYQRAYDRIVRWTVALGADRDGLQIATSGS